MFTQISIAMTNWFQSFSQAFYSNFIKEDRYMLMLNGLGVTLQIAFFAVILGVVLGFIMALLKLSRFKVLRGIAGVYIDIIRGTPTVTQLLIINFVVFASVSIPKVIVAVIAFGINSGAYVAEIIRAGILSIDKGQKEAGRSLGLNERQTMTYIIAPQAVKNILPALANEFIVLLKETAIVGYIAIQDLTKGADIIRSLTYDPFMPLIGSAIIYFVIIKILSILLKKLEKSLRKADAA